MSAALWVLVVTVVVNSVIGLFYYIRVTITLFLPPREGEEKSPGLRPVSFASGLTLAVLALIVICLGVYPAPVMHLIQASVASLFA